MTDVRGLLGARRIRVGELPIDSVDFDGALDTIDQLIQEGQGGTVFTPNVDHVVMAESHARFRAAYQGASLSLVDGVPVLWASRLLGTPLPMKVSGADLIWPLMRRAAERGHRVYFLGGAPKAAELARQKLTEELPALQIVGINSSRIEIDGDPAVTRALVEEVRRAEAQIVLVALGAPKQEIWSTDHLAALKPAVLVGVGASLDFVAGIHKRAPRWMSKVGLEWLYRLAQEPRRLAGRYLLRDPQFFWILARQLARTFLRRGTKKWKSAS